MRCDAVGTFTRRSASKMAMKRFSVLVVVVVALMAGGCFGGSSTKTVQIGPDLQNLPTSLVVKVSVAKLGQAPSEHTYRISCLDTGTGDGAERYGCDRLTGSHRDRYFGVQSGPKSAGPLQGTVTIRGLANGVLVKRSYYLGSKQFRDWMQILGRDPSGLVVQQ
jgi:hypothetical protein